MTDKKKTRQSKGKSKPKPKKSAKSTAKKAPEKAARKNTSAKPTEKDSSLHWLVRPDTIRKLWIGGGVVLAALVVVEIWVPAHGTFGLDDTFGFNAWFGFAACVAMIFFAKGLGKLLRRKDTYYL
ncbi:MAG: hypothetical protein HQ512_00870 [Rhodospirillales bacterium]|nr:hypothetical protein [Rhodospirillales bacterium]